MHILRINVTVRWRKIEILRGKFHIKHSYLLSFNLFNARLCMAEKKLIKFNKHLMKLYLLILDSFDA
ncbi:hypothetical protein T02_11678 [Trichinella nativa]|uniref:Uncharacterized protein n=1 Tax=Trichinella nativa TaxID=6335 RepID=A0A0V1LCF0_9BILA|nr:hypothetical protein T02_11678 [Trichinella nativa]